MAAAADLGKMKIGDFSSYLDQSFEAHAADGRALTLTLAEAHAGDKAADIRAAWQEFGAAPAQHEHIPMSAEHEEAAAKAKPEVRSGGAFTLRFDAAKGPVLPQGTYMIKHPKLGLFPLFLVPGQGHDGATTYYATFS